ncbi:MAG: isoprenylcysteine carboxylmethyltransferase family protein [Proteobacteria bacterium]|nr:isoprenylcysteine carboxylmethyltransferase family protein [Pseudomonadota bacterium]
MTGRIAGLVFNHRFGSAVGASFFSFWIVQRFYFTCQRTFLWWLVTFQFVIFVLSYLSREPPRDRATGFRETVFPFICAALPFALADYPFKPPGRALGGFEHLAGFLMIVGTGLIVAGVSWLRRSFSIMAEVRSPVTRGVYRCCRHPMYLGSLVAYLGMLLYRFSLLNLMIYAVFLGLQLYRASVEERKIAARYPEYRAYAARVGWLWRLGRLKVAGTDGDGKRDVRLGTEGR